MYLMSNFSSNDENIDDYRCGLHHHHDHDRSQWFAVADMSGFNQASGARVINAVGNTGANQLKVIRCYNCKEWWGMLLAQAQEAGVVLDEEQQDFLADSLEETDDCEDLQLQATTNFKADHVDAYDSDCDEATTNAIFMAIFSHVGSLNDDTVAPRYDSDTLSGVPHYNTYYDSDVLNSNIQELEYIEKHRKVKKDKKKHNQSKTDKEMEKTRQE
ncbi:hypothetical protein Tco_1313937 [Tanacetum coccineum]